MNFATFFGTIALLLGLHQPAVIPSVPMRIVWRTLGGYETLQPVPSVTPYPRRRENSTLGPVLTAHAAMSVDTETQTTLYEKNADEVRALASITKLATVMVALDHITDLDALVTIEQQDFMQLGYNNFAVGEQLRARDLLAAVLIASDNTAAAVLARNAVPEQNIFVDEMNKKAASLGLSKTRFADPTGLAAENVSTAREAAILAREAFRIALIRDLTPRRSLVVTTEAGRTLTLKTTDQLIGGSVRVLAGKTGFVTDSGYNFVAEVSNGKHPLTVVILGSETNPDRFQDLKMLSVWTWDTTTWQEN